MRILAVLVVATGCTGNLAAPGDLADAGADAGGPGTPDGGAEIVDGSSAGPDGSGVDPPGVPRDLTATPVSSTQIDLCWSPPAGASGTVAYDVFRDGVRLATVNRVGYEDRAAVAGTTHSYEVAAVTTGGESAHTPPREATAFAADKAGDVTAGNLRKYTTIQSIGLEWDVTGDADHDASAQVYYRAAGGCAWRRAMPLVRVDFNGRNMLAGSVLFLEEATAHDLVLHLQDPDGPTVRTLRAEATTRPVPAIPTGGRTLHVAPGSGGGDGSSGNPFQGVAAAQAGAQAGDVFLLHAGSYGGRVTFATGGTAGNHVVWKAAGDGDAVFAGVEVAASHLRLDGLRIEAGGGYDFPIGVKSLNAPADVAIVRCTIVGNHYGIWLNRGGSDWYIADNVIVGTNVVADGSFSGEGVELQHSAGHVVAHNRISLVADGVSYCDRDCDIHGNDIFDTSDDGVEVDDGLANVRVWGNRIHNAYHNAFSFQPQAGAPWYFVRNQIMGNAEAALKLRTTDRFLFVHNTVVEKGGAVTIMGNLFLSAYSRNNLWISVDGAKLWDFESGTPDWRTSLDYDGFDWGASGTAFQYLSVNYPDLAGFSAASGLEPHGVRVRRANCFPSMSFPAAPPASVPAQILAPAAACEGIDRGEILPNLSDGYLGAAPDLGAIEAGGPLPVYGPR